MDFGAFARANKAKARQEARAGNKIGDAHNLDSVEIVLMLTHFNRMAWPQSMWVVREIKQGSDEDFEESNPIALIVPLMAEQVAGSLLQDAKMMKLDLD